MIIINIIKNDDNLFSIILHLTKILRERGGILCFLLLKTQNVKSNISYTLLYIHSKMRMEVVINEKSSSKSISVAFVVWMFCC